MKLSIFGLGYVGVVAAACLTAAGHQVMGVDSNADKVALVRQGRSPIVEPGVDGRIAQAVASGAFLTTSDPGEAMAFGEICMVCVGTPSLPNGDLDLSVVRKVCGEIGEALRRIQDRRVLLVRSTMLPGSMRSVLIPILEQASGRRAGENFGVAHHPEFLREGSAVADFMSPPKIVFGGLDSRDTPLLRTLYRGIEAPWFSMGLEEAELLKYLDNTWHALKICFANEASSLARAHGLDIFQAMQAFVSDRQLNISEAYLRPGFAFGGSCLPKDVRALAYRSKIMDLETPVLSSIVRSNKARLEEGLRLVRAQSGNRVAILGFSFKANTDDLRESPMVELVERLKGKGYVLKLYDKAVSLAQLTGANKEFLVRRIPHVAKLMADSPAAAVSQAQTVVLSYHAPEFEEALAGLSPEVTVVDLSGQAVAPRTPARWVSLVVAAGHAA